MKQFCIFEETELLEHAVGGQDENRVSYFLGRIARALYLSARDVDAEIGGISTNDASLIWNSEFGRNEIFSKSDANDRHCVTVRLVDLTTSQQLDLSTLLDVTRSLDSFLYYSVVFGCVYSTMRMHVLTDRCPGPLAFLFARFSYSLSATDYATVELAKYAHHVGRFVMKTKIFSEQEESKKDFYCAVERIEAFCKGGK